MNAAEIRRHPAIIRAIDLLEADPSTCEIAGRADGQPYAVRRFRSAIEVEVGGEIIDYRLPGSGPHLVKCGECHHDMRRCETVRESAEGGTCPICRAARKFIVLPQ